MSISSSILAKFGTKALLLTAAAVWILLNGVSVQAVCATSILPNGAFEKVDASGKAITWMPYGKGYSVNTQAEHGGRKGIVCAAPNSQTVMGALNTLILNQQAATPVSISGWSKASSVGGSPDNDYSLYLDITYNDGSALWGQTALFDTGTHDWQQRSITLVPSRPIQSINIYALFRNHAGTAYFDDFEAHQIDTSKLFDLQTLAPPQLAVGARSGWFVRDVAEHGTILPISPNSNVHGLKVGPVSENSSSQLVATSLKNLTKTSRALTIYYVERFDPVHPIWWNDVRDASPAVNGNEYANLTMVSVGANGHLSLYPFGCVTGVAAGRALGVTPSMQPVVYRIGYNSHSHLLYIAYDIALQPIGDPARHDSAKIDVARYDVDPAWGFRSAAAKYYKLFPAAFAGRAVSGGIWLPFESSSDVAGADDFHFGFHEGDNSVASDHAHHILSFRYVEPMSYWMAMPPTSPRTYENAIDILRNEALGQDASGGESVRRQAQAVLYSGSKNLQGHYNVSFRDTPWCNGAVWTLNPDPNLPHPADTWTKAKLNTQGEPEAGTDSEPDGEYLDSMELMADVLDYRPESLAAAKENLTFGTGESRPTVPTWFSVYEGASALSTDLHSRAKLLMANTVPWRFSAVASALDVMGTETTMFSDTGAWLPESDSIMNLRRTIAYHKPYLLLLNSDYNKVSASGIELYFERCMFYGIFPSMFSANSSDNPYWRDPQLYNRDRPLFQKYIPVIDQLSTAGWEPVTYARSDNPAIWIERFGSKYLTLLNSSDAPQHAVISVDLAWFVSKPSTAAVSITAQDLFGSDSPSIVVKRGIGRLDVELRTSETKVIELTDSSKGAIYDQAKDLATK